MLFMGSLLDREPMLVASVATIEIHANLFLPEPVFVNQLFHIRQTKLSQLGIQE